MLLFPAGAYSITPAWNRIADFASGGTNCSPRRPTIWRHSSRASAMTLGSGNRCSAQYANFLGGQTRTRPSEEARMSRIRSASPAQTFVPTEGIEGAISRSVMTSICRPLAARW
ncbi:hypothetical protein FKP32DRAFT_824051 [Trametes sanguinea]|nr:hypothetical protein FKP32DRAFT_824051 [Trametes sanguinea]